VERYQALARRLVGVLPEPPMVVDWTDLTPNRRCRIPRAASCLATCDLRILIVTQYSWPENFRINDLAVGLRERGHEVTV